MALSTADDYSTLFNTIVSYILDHESSTDYGDKTILKNVIRILKEQKYQSEFAEICEQIDYKINKSMFHAICKNTFEFGGYRFPDLATIYAFSIYYIHHVENRNDNKTTSSTVREQICEYLEDVHDAFVKNLKN